VGKAFEAGVLMGGEVGADADSGTDSAEEKDQDSARSPRN